jgi:hypothetical protein
MKIISRVQCKSSTVDNCVLSKITRIAYPNFIRAYFCPLITSITRKKTEVCSLATTSDNRWGESPFIVRNQNLNNSESHILAQIIKNSCEFIKSTGKHAIHVQVAQSLKLTIGVVFSISSFRLIRGILFLFSMSFLSNELLQSIL